MEIRAAILGCGGFSSDTHGPSLAACADAFADLRLVGCCDLNREAAERYRKRFGFERAFSSIDALFREAQPNAVSVVVPFDHTAQVVCEVLQWGVPVMTEKPPGLTPAELEAMIEAAGPTPTAVAFNRRHHPLMAPLREHLATLGEPIELVRYTLARRERLDPDFSTTAVHAVDAARHIAGEDFAELTMRYRRIAACPAHVVANLVTGTFDSGANVQINVEPVTGAVSEIAEVFLRSHVFIAKFLDEGDPPTLIRLCGKERDEIAHVVDQPRFVTMGQYGEYSAFFQAVAAGRSPNDSLSTARQSVAVMAALRERAATWTAGQPQRAKPA